MGVCAEYCFWYYSTQGGPFFVKDERPSMETALRYRSHTAQPPFSFLVVPVGLAAHSHFPTADGPRPCYTPMWRWVATSLTIASRGTANTPPGAAGLKERPHVAFFLWWLLFSYFCLLLLTFAYFRKTAKGRKKTGKRTAAKEKRTATKRKEQEKNRKKKDQGPCPGCGCWRAQ